MAKKNIAENQNEGRAPDDKEKEEPEEAASLNTKKLLGA